MDGAEIIARLNRIRYVLDHNNVQCERLEFKVRREEWSDFIRTLQFYGRDSKCLEMFYAAEITYLGIVIRNPDAPPVA